MGSGGEKCFGCSVSAIVLAAGQARRMGQLKQLLPWRGATLIEHTIDCVIASGVAEIIVVLGYRAEEVTQRLAGKPVKIKINENYKGGMSSSLICGLQALEKKAAGIMVVLGDQPTLEVDTLRHLIREFCQRITIVVPVFEKRRGNPVIFPSKYINEMLALQGDRGAKSVVEAHPDDVIEVGVTTDSVIFDIDDIQEYRTLLDRDITRER
ncbi:MAG: 4-diphosphocytidyl-2C-methyl-D-erythritolsynthas e [Dehalococcoidia bacterium]|nr:4-diphosphocytidyl-2C-methyl-D-erythritolsynthas e [Dehalococcoidia bacterium]